MDMSIEGRAALVTGASRGIGKGIARGLAQAGANVMLLSRSEEEIHAAVDDIKASGATGELAWVVADVGNGEEMKGVADDVVSQFGSLDIVCCNAGIFPQTPLATLGMEEWNRVMSTNVAGTFLAVQMAMPAMRRQGGGRIIITSSITGPITGYPGWAHYGASKAAQLGFLRTAAVELAPLGITVNAVLPGNIATEGLSDLGEDYLAKMKAAIPHGRLGTVEDVAAAVLFFASPAAGYITGQALVVDGGQVLPESLEALEEAAEMAYAE
jgi:3-oxoacyl-[acyl-carrier protein] reductase